MRKEPRVDIDHLASAVIGATIDVHRHHDAGFLESVYQQSLSLESSIKSVAFEREAPVGLPYKGHSSKERFSATPPQRRTPRRCRAED